VRARRAVVAIAVVPVLAGTLAGAGACAGGGARPPADAAAAPRRPAPAAADTTDWRGQPAARAEELFVGRFPGVQVFAAPGGGVEVRIRGATSLNGSNEPLYVIDGYPLPTGTGGLLGINPSDIARIEVLKTAGDIAEYGVRGANGVVRITTKRAR
jgi:TonB-dependent SusC/RagA subfamily outer membrane receptor